MLTSRLIPVQPRPAGRGASVGGATSSLQSACLSSHKDEAGSNTAIVPCQSHALLAGSVPVRFSSSFYLHNIRIKRVIEKSLLVFASAESKSPPPPTSVTLHRQTCAGKWNLLFWFKGLILHRHSWVVSSENSPDKFYLTEQERSFPADPTFLKKKKKPREAWKPIP